MIHVNELVHQTAEAVFTKTVPHPPIPQPYKTTVASIHTQVDKRQGTDSRQGETLSPKMHSCELSQVQLRHVPVCAASSAADGPAAAAGRPMGNSGAALPMPAFD